MKIEQMEDEIHESINKAIVTIQSQQQQIAELLLKQIRLTKENARLLARCERYEGALKHYADEYAWNFRGNIYRGRKDGWAVAREALAKIKGEL